MCSLLGEELGLDFTSANGQGNTPLTKAIEHRREHVVRWLLESGRCEAAVFDAAGCILYPARCDHQYYHARAHALTRPLTHPPTHLLATCCSRYAARLAVRHSATDATERISEMLQSYLLAAHYAAAQAQAQAQAQAAEAAEAAEVELKGQEPSVAAVVPHGAQDVHVAAARHGALEERFELAKKEALRPGADRWGRVEGKEGGAPRRTLALPGNLAV